jgi:hypothetical protein
MLPYTSWPRRQADGDIDRHYLDAPQEKTDVQLHRSREMMIWARSNH